MKLITLFLTALVGALLAAASLTYAAPQEGWPCIQRKVPKLTAGAFWTGSPIDVTADWRANNEIARLVTELVSRRTPIERAEELIQDYAAEQKENRAENLKLLFTGVFNEINVLRSEIMSGIERFMKNQQTKTNQLIAARTELQTLANKQEKTADDLERLGQLQATVQWLQRIYDDREGSLTYVCETPVLLEQRLFALARAIQSHMS